MYPAGQGGFAIRYNLHRAGRNLDEMPFERERVGGDVVGFL